MDTYINCGFSAKIMSIHAFLQFYAGNASLLQDVKALTFES